jgi:hypothetical protein
MKIKPSDVKAALLDARFRDRLPQELLPDVQKFLKNPGCACNAPIYRKVLRQCPQQLLEYFPGGECEDPEEEAKQLAPNLWSVINCRADELESRLRALPPGRKQIAVARFEDQVTVVVNELDLMHTA